MGDVTEYGDLLSRSRALKEGLTVAAVTRWMEMPLLPQIDGGADHAR